MLTYDQACDLLTKGRKGRKKLENNTYLERHDEDTVAVVLHSTAVVKIRSDGTFVLNSGGWLTVTTKDRINNYSPVRVSSVRGTWKLYDGQDYYDGMRVDSFGQVL
jgi:hypothetical protein